VVLGSNLGHDTGCCEVFRGFLQSVQTNARKLLLPPKPFAIHHYEYITPGNVGDLIRVSADGSIPVRDRDVCVAGGRD
jgi:hypothetical protein